MATRLSDEIVWSEVYAELSSLFENKEFYNQRVVQRARTKVIMIWGDATSLPQRKSTLKVMKEKFDFKDVSYSTQPNIKTF